MIIKKALIFDSGPLINFSINGLLHVLEKLKQSFPGPFLITNEVKLEIYDHPLTIRQFELGALRINKLIENKTLQFPQEFNIDIQKLRQNTVKLTDEANYVFRADNEHIKIVSDAEMSCIALAQILKSQNAQVMLAIDERTARMLIEKPENLQKLLSQHLHREVRQVSKLSNLQNLQCIRSSELIYVAHKKGLTNLEGKKALEALIYATKFKGSSISWDEIEILKRL